MTIENDADERIRDKREEEKKKKRRRRRKKTILGFRSTDFFILEKYQPKNLSVLPFLSDRIGAEPKKSSQSKRTFLSLRQNTNCIGHTLRRVWGRKRRERERNARVFLSSSQRERESLFVAPSIVSQRRDLNRMII